MPLGPNFLVVGAAKAGTTSLAHYLRQHPDVFVAREKECHHFLFEGKVPTFAGPGDREEFNPLIIPERERYLECFAGAGGAAARGEASVYYMYRPEALERALDHDPAMKFVAVLRDPVDRAFSAYSHMLRDGREPLSFREALAAEARRAEQDWSYGFHYEGVGRYGAQLEAMDKVVPAGQLHVLLYDDLAERPAETMADIFAFLGLPDAPVDSSLVMNASGKPRVRLLNTLLTQRNPIKEGLKKVLPYELGSRLAHRVRNWNLDAVDLDDDDATASLRASFAPDVRAVSAYLGRDLSAWEGRR